MNPPGISIEPRHPSKEGRTAISAASSMQLTFGSTKEKCKVMDRWRDYIIS